MTRLEILEALRDGRTLVFNYGTSILNLIENVLVLAEPDNTGNIEYEEFINNLEDVIDNGIDLIPFDIMSSEEQKEAFEILREGVIAVKERNVLGEKDVMPDGYIDQLIENEKN